MQLASKFCPRDIPIHLRHSAPYFNQGLNTLTPQVSQLQVKGKHSSVWSSCFSLKQRQGTEREGEVGGRNAGHKVIKRKSERRVKKRGLWWEPV